MNFGDICIFVLLTIVACVSAIGFCAIDGIWNLFPVLFYLFMVLLVFITAIVVWIKERLF